VQTAHGGNKNATAGHNDVCSVWAKTWVLNPKRQWLGGHCAKHIFNGLAS
jgi:hypothetical protein